MIPNLLLAATLVVTSTQQPITIDGIIDEPAWEQGLILDDFVEMSPGDNVEPPVETIAYITYNHDFFYAAFRCIDPDPAKIRARYTDRDSAGSDDLVALLLDTFNDDRRAFFFQVNPLGVQMDATFLDPQGNDYSWDTVWYSAGRITGTGYEVEIAIPFKSIRFPDAEEQTWGFTAERYYPRESTHRITSHRNDRSRICWLCLDDSLAGLEDIRPGSNIEIIPAVTALRSDQRSSPDTPMEKGDEDVEASLTGTWGITSNLTLNGTVNPDFSQVEADAFQLDINRRFTLFFSEKRPFFMEGSNYFSTPYQAVYTRSITEPLWGLKLTGKEGDSAYGILVAEDDYATILVPGVEGSYTVPWDENAQAGIARYQHDLGEYSTLGGIATYRSAGSYSSWLAGADGRIHLGEHDEIRFQLLHSSTTYPDREENAAFDGESLSGNACYLYYNHFTRYWTLDLYYDRKDEDFRADLGFIPRVGTEQHVLNVGRRWYGKENSPFTMIYLVGAAYQTLDPDREMLDRGFGLFSFISLPYWGTSVNLGYDLYDESYESVTYADRHTFRTSALSRFSKWLTVGLDTVFYRGIDYENARDGDGDEYSLSLTFRPGRRLHLGTTARRSVMTVDGGELYRAWIHYASLNYFFTGKLFFRGILQRLDLDREPALYAEEITRESSQTGLQLLLSYRVNPFTLVYLGYSDFGFGANGMSSVTLNRTFFMKLSYAWRP